MGEQEPAARREGACSQWRLNAGGPAAAGPRPGCSALRQADDRVVARVAAEEETAEQRQERHGRQQESAKLGQGRPG